MAVTFAQIQTQPESEVLYLTRNPQMKSVQMLPVCGFNLYLVFYRIEDDTVRIFYVTHCARHLLRLFGRERRE